MWIYRSSRVGGFLRSRSTLVPRPRLLATARAEPKQFSHAPYSSIITNVQWSPDSRSIYFVAQSRNGNRRLSNVFLNSTNLRTLTADDEDVVQYVITSKTLAYVAVNSARQRRYADTLRGTINRDTVAPDSVALAKILFPHEGYEPQMTELWTWARERNRHVSKTHDERPEQVIDDPFDKALSISPNGRYSVRLRTLTDVPDAWSAYEPAPNEKHLRVVPGMQADDVLFGVGFLKQFVLTDTISGKTEALVQAPVGRYLGYAANMESKWSADGQLLLLTNTFLPLDATASSGQRGPIYPCLAAVVEVSTRHVECLQHFADLVGTSNVPATKLQDARFVHTGVVLTFGDSFHTGTAILYRTEQNKWTAASPEEASRLHFHD
jgi:hypothetical protein